MKKFLILSMIFVSCGSQLNVKPESELRQFSAKKILELAAKEYVNYRYDSAIYYYRKLLELHPEDAENTAWANYEIGFIEYKRNRYQKALMYFDRVLSEKSSFLSGSQVLAAKMKAKILKRKKAGEEIKKQEEITNKSAG